MTEMNAGRLVAEPFWLRLAAFVFFTLLATATGITIADAVPANEAMRAALAATLFTALATGAGDIAHAAAMLPWGLTFAAGAMLFVISHEIIPETHRNGNERVATIGLIAGFVLMMLFDTILR